MKNFFLYMQVSDNTENSFLVSFSDWMGLHLHMEVQFFFKNAKGKRLLLHLGNRKESWRLC